MEKQILRVLCALSFFLVMLAVPVNGQLSEGTTFSRTIKTGNRPQANDWGLYIGPSVQEVIDMCDNGVEWLGLPLTNIKYYYTDNLEFRLGLRMYRTATKTNGVNGRSFPGEELTNTNETKTKVIEGNVRLTPGVAYHFSSTNILDVYVGANLPFGFDSDKNINKGAIGGTATETSVSRNSFVLGLGAFVGLQCFIADLPLSIGLEYGFSGVKNFGQKYKHTIVNGNEKQVYYTLDKGGANMVYYDKLKSSKGSLGSDVRITFSYYFSK